MRALFLAISALAVGLLVFGPWDLGAAPPVGASASCSAAGSGGGGASVSNTLATLVGPSASAAPSCTADLTT